MNIKKNIELKFTEFTKQERKIALIALQEPEKVQNLGIKELSEYISTSPATITRFVKKIGCKDFYQFKLFLAASEGSTDTKVETTDTVQNILSYYEQILSDTWQNNSFENIDEVVDIIKKANRVYILGLGSSGYSAEEAGQRLVRMGINAFPLTDSHMMFISSSIMNKDDVILALSVSGNTQEINLALNIAKKSGVKIIAITGLPESNITQISDINIIVKNSHFVNDKRFVNSQLATIFTIDIITSKLLEDPTYNTRLSRTVDTILNRKLDNHS